MGHIATGKPNCIIAQRAVYPKVTIAAELSLSSRKTDYLMFVRGAVSDLLFSYTMLVCNL